MTGETTVDLGGPKQRAVLAVLVLRANAVVSTDTLVETVWGAAAPGSAVGIVRTYVSRLRQRLAGAGTGAELRSKRPGYVLEVDPDCVDAHRFERLASRARSELDAGRPEVASPLLDRALGLWRGDALADLAELPSLQPAATRLEQMRLATVEDRIDAELARGRHAEIVADLEALTREHPFRERFWRQLVVALYRSERQADALAACQAVRSTLVDQMGVDPGPELQALEREVLTQAGTLRWQPPSPTGPTGSERQEAGQEAGPPGRQMRLPAAIAQASSEDRSFVGRADERAVLARALDAARAGAFGALFLTGVPGIGKTALAARFGRDADMAGAAVVAGRADEAAGVPFQPLREAIHHWATHSEPDELRLLDDADAATLARVVPSLASRRGDSLPEASGFGDAAERIGLFEAIARWVGVLGAGRAAVIVLEDLHWADPATVLAMRHLVRHPPPVGAVLLATLRDTELAGDHPLSEVLTDARGDRHVQRLDLTGLADDDVVDLLEARTGAELSEAGRAFAVRLNRHTGGHPLFVHETLRHLIEQDAIDPAADDWAGGHPIEAFGVPTVVVELIDKRLRRLPTATTEVLRPASVLGQRFELPVLSRVVDRPEIDVVESLEPGLADQLVTHDTHDGGRPDRFEFAHTLVRQAIVDGLPLSQQARLHWGAGMALRSLSAAHPEPRLAQVAHHLTAGAAAGDARTAIAANVRAGQQALASFAFEDARTWLTTATDLLGTTGVTDPDLAYTAWLALGQAAGALADAERQRAGYVRAATIARQQRWPQRLARAAIGFAAYTTGNAGPGLGDEHLAVSLTDDALAGPAHAPTVDRCLLLATKTVHAVSCEEVDQACDLAGAAREMADALDDPTALAGALMARCWTLLGTPRPEELDETARRVLSLAARPEARILLRHLMLPLLPVPALQRGDQTDLESIGDHTATAPETGPSPHAAALRSTWKAAIALGRGRFDHAEHLITTIAGTSDWPIWQAATHLQTAIVALERGAHADVEATVERLLSSAPDAVAPRAVFAMLQVHAGRHAEAAGHVDLLRRQRPLDRLGWCGPLTLRHLAEVAARLDDARLAGELLPVLAAYSGQMLVSYTGTTVDAAADRAIGQVLLPLGRLDEAIDRLAAAHALERSLGAHALVTRTTYWQARARLQRDAPGDHQAAHELLHQASSQARQLGMNQLAGDADHQLRLP